MLTFNGSNLLGIHLPVYKQPPEIRAMRTSFFGVNGESEIFGESGGRIIEVEAWITDDSFSSSDSLMQHIRDMESVRGQNGTLERSGVVNETMSNCTFEGFQELPPGPLFDYAGTMSPNGVQAWFTRGIFRFYQLLVD